MLGEGGSDDCGDLEAWLEPIEAVSLRSILSEAFSRGVVSPAASCAWTSVSALLFAAMDVRGKMVLCVCVRKPSEQERAIYPAESMIAEVAMLFVSGPLVNKSMPRGPGSPSSATFGCVGSVQRQCCSNSHWFPTSPRWSNFGHYLRRPVQSPQQLVFSQ